MMRTARKWLGRREVGRAKPDPIHEAIRHHQLAVARLEAAVSACAELESHVLAAGLKSEECGLPVLDSWRYRMEWAAYYALQCLLSTVPTTTTGVTALRTYVREQALRAEAEANPSLPVMRTREVLARFLDRET
jgi:hypothetical protein